MAEAEGLNESHRRRLLANAQHADKLVSEIHEILNAGESRSPFQPYRPDVSPQQARLIRSHLARFRSHLSRVLQSVGAAVETGRLGSLHSIRVALTFIRIAVEEMAPERLRGYGELDDATAAELRGLCAELEGLISNLERTLALGAAADIQARLAQRRQATQETELLRLLDRVINAHELAEFSAPLIRLVEKLESPHYEIAVFGRVSSGKSSLLNHLLGTDVLPVGVNPITAVPTRLLFASEPCLTVTSADRQVKQLPISELARFASEEENPGNELGITRLVVALPSARLENGLVLVDTPGLGALATAGAAQTLSYLPQCDLGILLISAGSPINDEDLDTLQTLTQAGIPAMVLLSKADLLSAADREKARSYIKKQVQANLGMSVDVYPVSTSGADEKLLEEWFGDHLAPLFARHRELAKESLRRKAALLRESVAAALRGKLDSARGIDSGTGAVRVGMEQELRRVAGEIDSARQFCLGASDEVRTLAEAALQRAVDLILKRWSDPETGLPVTDREILAGAEEVASAAVAPIAGRLAKLAQELQRVLISAAEALGGNADAEDPLERFVREMPRFEAALPAAALPSPRFARWRWRQRLQVSRWVRRVAWADLRTAFANYRRSVEAWLRRVLADLQQAFDARADMYRAQLARVSARQSLSSEELSRLQRDLAELERLTEEESEDRVATLTDD